jgi:tetratricopeptide (TPR) repeat protein
MGVDFVLAGSITDKHKVLTTKVEMIKVSDGSLVWGTQHSEFGLLSMELPEVIAQDVAQKLQLRLSDEERRRLTKRYTQNAAAYEAYIKGNVLFWGSPASLKKSAEYYQQAINLDPNFALPYSQMGGVRQLSAVYGMTPPRESYQEANEWWAKALQRDDSLTVVQVQMQAQKFWLDWDWEGIEKAGKRTGVYFDYLGAMGRLDESLAANKQWQAWMPTSSGVTCGVGFDLYYMHRYDEAIEQFKKAISLDPDDWPAHFFLGFTYSQKGMHEEAIAEMQRSIELQENAPPSVAGLGYVYAVAGRRDEAVKILNRLQERADRGEYVWPLGIALIHIGLGNKDDAFAWLDKAYEDRSTGMNYLKVNPLYDPLRSDPRFLSLLQRMRFPT